MSFYSYKNANASCCPGMISGDATQGLQEKVCVQVKRVYDSALWQEQIDNAVVTITSFAQVSSGCNSCNPCNPCNPCGCDPCGCNHVSPCGCNGANPCDACGDTVPPTSTPVPPITFESCRSSTTEASIRNLTVERLCDRPCFARVRCTVDVPIDILFMDSRCIEYIGKGVVSVDRDVLLSIPDESIVPYTLEAMASAICVSGCFVGNNQFKMTVCVTIILKVLADVEILVPSYGYCAIPPAEEFADSVCTEFFSLPLFPTASPCNTGHVSAQNVGCTCNNACRCDCTPHSCGHGNSCQCRC
ncbi:MAG: hypothetical protein PUC00_04300 [Clostridiales bacterium]|nr:hypothetical protein [Clostridiales bacterium]